MFASKLSVQVLDDSYLVNSSAFSLPVISQHLGCPDQLDLSLICANFISASLYSLTNIDGLKDCTIAWLSEHILTLLLPEENTSSRLAIASVLNTDTYLVGMIYRNPVPQQIRQNLKKKLGYIQGNRILKMYQHLISLAHLFLVPKKKKSYLMPKLILSPTEYRCTFSHLKPTTTAVCSDLTRSLLHIT